METFPIAPAATRAFWGVPVLMPSVRVVERRAGGGGASLGARHVKRRRAAGQPAGVLRYQ